MIKGPVNRQNNTKKIEGDSMKFYSTALCEQYKFYYVHIDISQDISAKLNAIKNGYLFLRIHPEYLTLNHEFEWNKTYNHIFRKSSQKY